MTMKATVKTLAAIVAMVATSATLPVRADTVTADAALAAAKGWVNLRQSMDGGALSAPESAKAYPGADGKGTYYVVSLSGGGYVVTSGDTFLKPVLSYAASGAWEEDETKNPLVLFVKCDVAASAAAMPETGSAVASANAAEWAKLAAAASQKSGSRRLAATVPTADLRVAPLLTTSWSQGSVGGALCYNYYTPGNYVCGCAATAMAQVMKYFRYPTAKVTAGEGYYDSVNYDGTDVGWNMDGYFASATATTKTPWDEGDHPAFGGPYDWDAMVDSPTSSTSETARKAIGQICRDAGLTVFAHYNVNNSGETSGFNGSQASALVKTFGYAGATASPYNENAMLASLDAGLPVIVELAGNGGHGVVADGYGYDDGGTLYVHFNFGWGDDNSGRWYTPPNVQNFTSIQRMTAAIFTPAQGTRGSSVISGRVLDANGSPVSGATVTAKNALGTVVATKTSNAKGIYAFIIPAGSYLFTAESGSDKGERLCTVESTASPLRPDSGWGGESTVNHSQSGVDVTFGQTVTDGGAAAIDIGNPTAENTPDYLVEWVQPSASLYVDTGVKGKVGVKAEVKFANVSCGDYPVMLGSWGARRFNLIMHWGQQARWEYGDAMRNWGAFPWYGTLVTAEVEVSAAGAMTGTWTDQAGGKITPSSDDTATYGLIDTDLNLFLFASNLKGSPSQPHLGRVYRAKLWTGDTGSWTPARDFIPCVKDGVAGLYDTVSQTIFYPQGNTLIAGPALNSSGHAIGFAAHPATQWGRISYGNRGGMGNGQWWHLPLGDYTFNGDGDIDNLLNSSWRDSYLRWSQDRFDGWFYVSSDKAGTWSIRQKFDDYFAIFIDNSLVLYNNSYTGEATSTVEVSAGWHRFTIIAGDTYGGYGPTLSFNGGSVPFTVTVNGTAYAFNNTNFPQGSGSNNYTLTANEDWTELGPILLAGGAVLDLNGHQLTVKDIACDEFVGAYVTNSASKKAVLLFTGEPTKTKAIVDGLVKEVGTKIMLAQEGAQSATWTGAAGDGNALNANNWQDTLTDEAVVPTANHALSIVGTAVNLQIPSGSTFACKSIDIGNCTLTADCDWSGLSVKPTISGTANLNGHVLTLNDLSAISGAAISGGEGSALAFAVADASYSGAFNESTFIDNVANLTISGSAKILFPKSGSGTSTIEQLQLGASASPTEFAQSGGTVSLGAKVHGIAEIAGKKGVYTMTGGTLTTPSGSEFQVGRRGTGEFIQTGGTVTLNNWMSLAREAAGSKGTYTMSGDSVLNLPNQTLYMACQNDSEGTLTVGGNAAANLTKGIWMGVWNGSNRKGRLIVKDNGAVNIAEGDIYMGQNKGGIGIIDQTGGSLSVSGSLQIGKGINTTGTMTMSGGTATTGGDLYVGRDGTGTLNLYGGDMTVGGLVRIPWGTGGLGYMTMTGGTFTVNNNNILVADGGKGKLVQNDGTVTVSKSDAYVCMGYGSTGVGHYELNGGTLVTPKVRKGDGTATLLLNGGTLKATAAGAIIDGVADVQFNGGEFTLDSNGNNVSMANSTVTGATGPAKLVKAGSGTLTVGTLPPVGTVKVAAGTLALTSGSTFERPLSLAHRWSFNGDWKDSVTGVAAEPTSTITFTEDGMARIPGGTAADKEKNYIELGSDKLPSDSVTMEFWVTLRADVTWPKMFCLGENSSSVIGFTFHRNSATGPSGIDVTDGGTFTGTGTLTKNVPYYFAFTFQANPDGSTSMKVYCVNTATGELVGTINQTFAGWKLTEKITQTYFRLGYSFWNDGAAQADYDEVRVWTGAMSKEGALRSAALGPNASFGEIELATGGTLDLGGQTLTWPSLACKGGAVQNGTLKVSGVIDLNVNDAITNTGVIDLSDATINLVDPENLTGGGFTFISGSGTVTGKPAATNLPKGWGVSISGGKARISKGGMTLILR